ncbi:hypothetical protein M885DRAFT_292970 [Pelagophyceae sp. CCMP2097]|nr:hypothetical protein M885DRAFT_292970 [Pelagophyceae sp. CCMP2097]
MIPRLSWAAQWSAIRCSVILEAMSATAPSSSFSRNTSAASWSLGKPRSAACSRKTNVSPSQPSAVSVKKASHAPALKTFGQSSAGMPRSYCGGSRGNSCGFSGASSVSDVGRPRFGALDGGSLNAAGAAHAPDRRPTSVRFATSVSAAVMFSSKRSITIFNAATASALSFGRQVLIAAQISLGHLPPSFEGSASRSNDGARPCTSKCRRCRRAISSRVVYERSKTTAAASPPAIHAAPRRHSKRFLCSKGVCLCATLGRKVFRV